MQPNVGRVFSLRCLVRLRVEATQDRVRGLGPAQPRAAFFSKIDPRDPVLEDYGFLHFLLALWFSSTGERGEKREGKTFREQPNNQSRGVLKAEQQKSRSSGRSGIADGFER